MLFTPCLCRNRKLQTSKAPLKSQAQGTNLFTSAASNQRDFPKNSPWQAQVRFPEGERMRQIRGVFQRIVRGKLRSGCQEVRGCVTNCYTFSDPLPLERDVLYGRPLR